MLDAICSLVNSDTLNALLEDDTLLDANVVYYYFDVLKSECPDAYLVNPNIFVSHIDTHRTSIIAKFMCCTINVYLFIILTFWRWWQGKQKAGDDAAFDPKRSRV